MKLRVMSDLHLEIYPYEVEELPDDKNTVLILAGDITSFESLDYFKVWVNKLANKFRQVIWLAGNHEHYHDREGFFVTATRESFGNTLANNIHYLTAKDPLVIEDVAFIGDTLWTNFNHRDLKLMTLAKTYMNDYRVTTLTPKQTLELHYSQWGIIQDNLSLFSENGYKTVLITHHGISRYSIHEMYEFDDLNGCFVSDYTEAITDIQPALAIHGHVHQNFDYTIGATRVIVNPRAYPNENSKFNPTLTVEI